MKKLTLTIAGLIFLMISSASAKEESWYWQFGIGGGKAKYPSDYQAFIDTLPGKEESNSAAFDLGFYWPVASNLILGPAITAFGHSVKVTGGEFNTTQSGLYASLIYTVGSEPGSGLLLRADLGFAKVRADLNGTLAALNAESDTGIGLNLGTGYGLALSDETRLLLQIMYQQRWFGDDAKYSAWTLTIGPMF